MYTKCKGAHMRQGARREEAIGSPLRSARDTHTEKEGDSESGPSAEARRVEQTRSSPGLGSTRSPPTSHILNTHKFRRGLVRCSAANDVHPLAAGDARLPASI